MKDKRVYLGNRPQVSLVYITIIHRMQIWRTTRSAPGTSMKVRLVRPRCSYPTRANGIIVLVNSQTGFCHRFLFPQFYKAVRKENLAHYFPYDVKLGLLAHSRSFLANQKARNAIVGAENLLKANKPRGILVEQEKNCSSGLPTSQMVYHASKP